LNPGGLRFELEHPVEQQDRKEQGEKTKGNINCVHKSDPSWRGLQQTGSAGHSLVEKPKVGELQMDWLRSEDLKEEKTQSPQ
jgi:hypothetical protein